MANHRLVVPVEGVDQARRAVDVPAVAAVVLEEFLRVGGQPAWGEHAGAYSRSLEMQEQSSPFETVSRRGAVGAKTIGRVVVVVLAQRLPVAVEMLDHQIVIGGGVTMNHSLDDALGAV
ncbi:hypothetical protein D3C73_1408780 [compost metagenome]